MKCDCLFFYLELSEILMLMLLIFYSRDFANSLIYVPLDKWLLFAFKYLTLHPKVKLSFYNQDQSVKFETEKSRVLRNSARPEILWDEQVHRETREK